MRVSFYLRHKDLKVTEVGGWESKKPHKDSKFKLSGTAIYARVCYENNDMKFYISESMPPEYWNKETQRAKESRKFPQYPEFNAYLDNYANEIKRVALTHAIANDNIYPSPDKLRELLNERFKPGKGKVKYTILSFFDLFITHCKEGIRTTKKGTPITPGTIKNYTTTKAVIESYQNYARKKLDFASIDMSFYNDFKTYLTKEKKLSTNYIGKHIKELKSVLNYATSMQANTYTGYKSGDFTATTEQTDSIYLPEHELREIEQLNLSQTPRLDKVRDLFLIGCYTGLRFSDLSALRPENIEDGLITIKQIKTGQPIAIPVHEAVEKIMNKYGGLLPKALSNQKMNDAIKDVAKQCKSLKKKVSVTYTKGGQTVAKAKDKGAPEKWRFVTTHTMRRSFATNQYHSNLPTITIMAITGHKTETAFMKYIKVAALEHANIIKGHWDRQKKGQTKTIAI